MAGEKGEVQQIIGLEGGKAGYRSYSIHYTNGRESTDTAIITVNRAAVTGASNLGTRVTNDVFNNIQYWANQ
ncbi:hypothetical protein IM756_16460 [Bacillus subtilis]|nr:hypothetical protein [Bacillus subtilis]